MRHGEIRISLMRSTGPAPRRFFFTDGHGFHRGRWLRELRGREHQRWVSISTTLPLRVVPRPGCENGIVDTVEKYISVFEHDSEQITVEDALREAGASIEFPHAA